MTALTHAATPMRGTAVAELATMIAPINPPIHAQAGTVRVWLMLGTL